MKLAAAALLGLFWGPIADDPVVVGFDVLASYEFVEGMEFPAEVTQHHEQSVTITGFMRREEPGDGDVEFFLLINDACGCEGTPKITEIIYCAMPEGTKTDVFPGLAKVTGTLYVQEEKEDGEVIGVYALDVDEIQRRKAP